MINVGINAGGSILATRRGGDVLIADEPTRVEFVWTDLRASDGEEIRIVWAASVACVDSAADRALLAERYFGDSAATLVASRVSSDLSSATGAKIRPLVSARSTNELLAADASLASAIEAAARSAAFAAGLAVLPPFRLTVTSPSLDRELRLAEARERLTAIAESDDARARSLANAARVLSEAAGDGARAARAIAALRLADPRDVLPAAAIVEPTWSAASPSLWIAAGTRLARVDPTAGVLDVKSSPSLGDALGPIRSVNPATIDGESLLLVGARDGVHVVSTGEHPRVLRSLRHASGSEFGFNAACFVPADRTIVATHSRAGVVSWRWDEDAVAEVVRVDGGARSAVSLDEQAVLLVADGLLATFTRAGGVMPIAGGTRAMSVPFASSNRERSRLVSDDVADGRYARVVGIEDELEVAGVRRVVRPLAAGGIEMIDLAGAMPLAIGPASLAARSVAMRPGFGAAVSVDRMRVSLIDLAEPDAVKAELHVAAALGSRVADVCFG